MKRILLFTFLAVFAFGSSVYAQGPSVRLGTSSASYNGSALNNTHGTLVLGTEGALYYVGTRLDFNRDSGYWTVAQLEFGPSFLRAGPGLILGEPNHRNTNLKVDLSVTFKLWRGLYLNSRWAPVSLNNRPNSKNFLDVGVGWQFKF